LSSDSVVVITDVCAQSKPEHGLKTHKKRKAPYRLVDDTAF